MKIDAVRCVFLVLMPDDPMFDIVTRDLLGLDADECDTVIC